MCLGSINKVGLKLQTALQSLSCISPDGDAGAVLCSRSEVSSPPLRKSVLQMLEPPRDDIFMWMLCGKVKTIGVKIHYFILP